MFLLYNCNVEMQVHVIVMTEGSLLLSPLAFYRMRSNITRNEKNCMPEDQYQYMLSRNTGK